MRGSATALVAEARRLAGQDAGTQGWARQLAQSVIVAADDDLGTLVVARAVLTKATQERAAELARMRAADEERERLAQLPVPTAPPAADVGDVGPLAAWWFKVGGLLCLPTSIWASARSPNEYNYWAGLAELFAWVALFGLIVLAVAFHRAKHYSIPDGYQGINRRRGDWSNHLGEDS